jgi:RND family efflux transporter MFP subunit
MALRKKVVWQLVIVVLLLAAGAAIMATFVLSKKAPARKAAPVITPLVRVVQVDNRPLRITVRGEGTVQPWAQASLAAEVAGRVVYIAPSLVAGGSFKKGEVLLRLEQEDYRLALALAEAEVKSAETNLRLMEEEAAAAREEWRLLGNKGTPPPLVVKKPQLAREAARLEAAKAKVRQGRLALARTEIKAPFDGRVIDETVDMGQYLAKGQSVATIFSTEAAEIRVYLDDRDLAWLMVPGLTGKRGRGSPAVVKAEFAGRQFTWRGRVVRALGKVDERTRMVGVVVRVDHPYASLPPLAMGLFVRVEIQGEMLDSASIIPRAALRQGNVVWVVDQKGRLVFRKVKLARKESGRVVLSPGLPQGALVVISPLRVVSDGMTVRTTREEG